MTHVLNKLRFSSRSARKICSINRNYMQFLRYNCLPTNNSVKCTPRLNRLTLLRAIRINDRFVVKPYSSEVEDFQTDETYEEIEEMYFDTDDKQLRSLLYPKSEDEIILRLNDCLSIQSVFNVINEESANLKHFHICQTILILWDLQRIYDKIYLHNLQKVDIISSPEAMLGQYVKELTSHADFQTLLQHINLHYHQFNNTELSCVIFYLKKMGVDLNNSVFNSLVELAYERIIDKPEDWTLDSLARYSTIFDTKQLLRSIILIKDIIPSLLKYLDKSDNIQDFSILTTSLHKIHIFISDTILQQYKDKLKSLLDADILKSDHSLCVIKIITFLNLPHWSERNFEEISYLCKFIIPSIENMSATQVISLHKVFQTHLEPTSVIEPLGKRAKYFLESAKNDDRISTYIKLPDLVFCEATTSPRYQRDSFEGMIEHFLNHSFPSTFLSVYKILRFLKIPNQHLCEKMWCNLIEIMHVHNLDDYKLLRLCYKYMHFNNNLGQIYLSNSFERVMIRNLLKMQENIAGVIPWKFSTLSAFLIAYGFTRRNPIDLNVLNDIVKKLESFSDQLTPLSCMILSKSLQIHYLTNYKYDNHEKKYLILQMDKVLNKCAANYTKRNDLSLLDLNFISKSYLYRRNKSDELYNLLPKYVNVTEPLSTRSVRDGAFIFLKSGLIIRPFVDRMLDYIIKKNDDILADTVHKVFHLCYLFGHFSKNDAFYNVVTNIVDREKDNLNGLSLLQFSLALCFFGCLPSDLIKHIFSIDFMERLDEEINSCYSKLTYPIRVRNHLMQLNRAVCLELPQHEIPWFHEKYIQERISLTPVNQSTFHNEVLNMLVKVVGKKDAIKHPFFSPYGYKIDFLIQLDNKKPIVPTSRTQNDSTKKRIAVLLLDSHSFVKIIEAGSLPGTQPCIKIEKNGPSITRLRHLEQMGFHVVEIFPSLWNSMHMAEPKAKMNYLYQQIYGK